MLFKKASDVPKEVSEAKVKDWYMSLSDQDRTKLSRYLGNAVVSSPFSFYSSVASLALNDENYSFTAAVCERCLATKLSEMQAFAITETLIDAYIAMKRYDDAKVLCEKNLKLYPSVKNDIMKVNGGSLPEKMNCRNRYIDIVIGIESGYDEAFRLLDRFFEMGLINSEDLAFRTQSLKIHRLQRSFDGVFTYSYKD